ncbi:MAG: hypothetical protein VKJ04_04445 [Vampirovibrionales bacterium]|nr:hypothetical protein [Vampirovibrionales bacterium]
MSALQARLLKDESLDWSYQPSQHRKSSLAAARPAVNTPLPRVKGHPQTRVVKSSYVKKGMPAPIYWMALFALVFCVFQCVRTILVETYSMTARIKSQPIIERYYQEIRQENNILRNRIQNASTRRGIEAIARNSLSLTGDGEILVRLH